MIHPLSDVKTTAIGENTNIWQFCVVFPDAKIGSNTTILPGITIGENAMTDSGSVVTKDVPANELWIKNPIQFYTNMIYNNLFTGRNDNILLQERRKAA